MASLPKLISFCVLILMLQRSSSSVPTPTPWPDQFHAFLFTNHSGILQKNDWWYDWTNGRDLNIMQQQLGELVYNLEWKNGTAIFYTNKSCRTEKNEVGMLPPNWLEGAEYLGQRHVEGFFCNVWHNVDFILYYEDVVTKRPVYWVFYTGKETHVMTFEAGATLEDAAKWQTPVHCFDSSLYPRLKLPSM